MHSLIDYEAEIARLETIAAAAPSAVPADPERARPARVTRANQVLVL